MPDWNYKSTSCRNGQIVETWEVCCSDDDESVCKSLGCHQILDDLVTRPGGSEPSHGDRTNPGLAIFVQGLGYPYVNRPCDSNDPTQSLWLGIPEIDGNTTQRGGKCCKTVRLTWKPRPDGQSQQPQTDEEPSQEVDQWCPQISSSSVERIVAAKQMVFGGVWQANDTVQDGGCCTEPAAADLQDMEVCRGQTTLTRGRCYTPQASNGQPYPALELRKTDRSYRMKFFRGCRVNADGSFVPFNESVFDGWEGTTNCNEIEIRVDCRCWRRIFKPRTLFLSSISTDPQFLELTNPLNGAVQNYPLYCVTFELIHRPETWDIDLLDAGTLTCDETNPNPDGCLVQEVITDAQGFAVDHETPLNGSGDCLPISEREWYTRWRAKCRTWDSLMPTLGTYIVSS